MQTTVFPRSLCNDDRLHHRYLRSPVVMIKEEEKGGGRRTVALRPGGDGVSFTCNRIAMLILSRSTDTRERERDLLRVSRPSSSLKVPVPRHPVSQPACRSTRVFASNPNTPYRKLRCCRGVLVIFPLYPRRFPIWSERFRRFKVKVSPSKYRYTRRDGSCATAGIVTARRGGLGRSFKYYLRREVMNERGIRIRCSGTKYKDTRMRDTIATLSLSLSSIYLSERG